MSTKFLALNINIFRKVDSGSIKYDIIISGLFILFHLWMLRWLARRLLVHTHSLDIIRLFLLYFIILFRWGKLYFVDFQVYLLLLLLHFYFVLYSLASHTIQINSIISYIYEIVVLLGLELWWLLLWLKQTSLCLLAFILLWKWNLMFNLNLIFRQNGRATSHHDLLLKWTLNLCPYTSLLWSWKEQIGIIMLWNFHKLLLLLFVLQLIINRKLDYLFSMKGYYI